MAYDPVDGNQPAAQPTGDDTESLSATTDNDAAMFQATVAHSTANDSDATVEYDRCANDAFFDRTAHDGRDRGRYSHRAKALAMLAAHAINAREDAADLSAVDYLFTETGS
jgi:hypothetical protein